MGRESDPIVLSYSDSIIRKSDVNLLMGTHWINDQLISFYYEYLTIEIFNKYSDRVLFIGPEVVQCLKFLSNDEIIAIFTNLNALDKSFIFFPMNNNETVNAGGIHWYLLVYSRVHNLFWYFDSMGDGYFDDAQLFAKNIGKLINASSNAIVSPHRILQQTNGYDCGIHVLVTTEQFAKHLIQSTTINGGGGGGSSGIQQSNLFSVTKSSVLTKRADILNLIMEKEKMRRTAAMDMI